MDDVNLAEKPRPTLSTMMQRRRLLGVVAALGATALAACGSKDKTVASTATDKTVASTATDKTAASTATDGSCTLIPEETAGPFPGDGSNGKNVLTQDGVVRKDIRSSFGSSTTTAPGIPLDIHLVIEDVNGCAPIKDAAVYAWHCDRDGNYSMYSSGVEGENYLRGVQSSDSSGVVAFRTIFPGAYSGRWPHVHFEVYRSAADATGGGRPIATSQIAFPPEICDQVYAMSGYESSRNNFAGMSLTSDMVFGDDGGVHQIGTMTGTVESGLTVTLNVPVSP